MTPKEISIDILDPRSIDDALRAIDDYEVWLTDKTSEFLERLAEEAVKTLEQKVSRLEGDTDHIVVPIRFSWNTDGSIDVCAEGSQILFLEFGTGTQKFPDIHPEKPPGILGRGEYGQKKGRFKTWGFYSEDAPGMYGWNPKNNPGVILTHGIPAQMPVYETIREIERKAAEIAREVFI